MSCHVVWTSPPPLQLEKEGWWLLTHQEKLAESGAAAPLEVLPTHQGPQLLVPPPEASPEDILVTDLGVAFIFHPHSTARGDMARPTQ